MEWSVNISFGDVVQAIIAGLMVVNLVQSLRNGTGIREIHKATNSMKDELVRATGEKKFAEGVKQAEDAARAKE